jgi:hypothetical protein
MYLVIDRYHNSRLIVVLQHQEKLIAMRDIFMLCVTTLDACFILGRNASNTSTSDSVIETRE